jgi:hypothetical protein
MSSDSSIKPLHIVGEGPVSVAQDVASVDGHNSPGGSSDDELYSDAQSDDGDDNLEGGLSEELFTPENSSFIK